VGNEKNEDKNTKDEITQLGNGKNETKEHIELFQDLGLNTLSNKPIINRSTFSEIGDYLVIVRGR
jgi:hypothetical protein